ncbi:MAG: TerB family tellurite resistance protein [Bacteroidales bacterium]
MENKTYFTALGQLIYAVAMADGAIQPEEREKIFHFVISQLVELERGIGNGKQAIEAFFLEKEFHRLKDEGVSMDAAYNMFVKFLEEHRNEFTHDHKQTCLEVMDKVAGAYNGIEESEQMLIEKVRQRIESL